MAKVDELIDAIVEHVTRHGGEGAQAVLDAQAKYKGEQTNQERADSAAEEAAAEQEKGKAANKKQVEEAAKASPTDDDEDDN